MMKVQCPECREIVGLEKFETSEQGLRFVCAACGRTLFVPNARTLDSAASAATPPRTSLPAGGSATPGAPANADWKTCPKCGHAQPTGEACHRCGLNFLHFDPINLPPDPPEAAALWEQILARPNDLDLHGRFLNACNQAGRLEYATRQYRILARIPGTEAVIEQMRLRILSLAQAQLAPAGLVPDDRETSKRRGRIILWIMMLVALGGFALLVYFSSDMLKKIY